MLQRQYFDEPSTYVDKYLCNFDEPSTYVDKYLCNFDEPSTYVDKYLCYRDNTLTLYQNIVYHHIEVLDLNKIVYTIVSHLHTYESISHVTSRVWIHRPLKYKTNIVMCIDVIQTQSTTSD
jgi:hypothetical protein